MRVYNFAVTDIVR